MDKYEALKQYFGYDRFRPGQEAVIDRLSAGQDVLCVMPTGGGKSICYQIPALTLPGLTIVISPLISLMRDQVDALRACSISAACLNSSLDAGQYRQVLAGLYRGEFKILYCAPERLDSPAFLEAVSAQALSLVAVDEAHCVSQWGQDFRPSYLKIPAFLQALAFRPAVGAFTATATRQVSTDIEKLLDLRAPFRITTGFDRPNLYFGVLTPDDKDAAVLSLVRQHAGKSGIVYCSTRKAVEYLSDLLLVHGISATRYHAGLSDEERQKNQDDFLYDRRAVMVATNAFGMGIDKSNVRYVLHYQMPMDLESYYQEAGRAGRDGDDADCILLFAKRDVRVCKYLIENSEDNPELDDETKDRLHAQALRRLSVMVNYCRTEECLRAYILRYFGQESGDFCGNCSNCAGGFEEEDITLDAQKVISCVVRSGQKYGQNMLVDLLRGERKAAILASGLDKLSTFGILHDRTPEEIRSLLETLLAQEILRRSPGEFPILGLAPRAAAVIREGEKVILRRPKKGETKEEGGELFEILKRVRAKLAIRASVQPEMVFYDHTLREMCDKMPKTSEDLMEISGVVQYKCSRYGAPFLEAINAYRKKDEVRAPVRKNAHQAWTEEEETILRLEVQQGIRLSQISREHGRTRAEILERIRSLGLSEE